MSVEDGVEFRCNIIKIIKEQRELVKCPICFEVYNEPIQLKCRHTFCEECLDRSIKEKCVCPICRQPINRRDKYHNEQMDHLAKYVKSILAKFENIIELNSLMIKPLSENEKTTLFYEKAKMKVLECKKAEDSIFINKSNLIDKPSTSFKRRQTKSTDIIPSSIIDKPHKDAFDILLESSKTFLNKKPLKSYRGKKKVIKKPIHDTIIDFEDNLNKINIISWLSDSRNMFDRHTQTPVDDEESDEGSATSFNIDSVSQAGIRKRIRTAYQKELKKIRTSRADIREKSRYNRRCRSLDIYKTTRRCYKPLQRQSISCESQDFENIIIEEYSEKPALTAPNVKVLHDLENECLDRIDEFVKLGTVTQNPKEKKKSDHNRIKSKVGNSGGWQRLKKMEKIIKKQERKPEQLKISQQKSMYSPDKTILQNTKQIEDTDNEDLPLLTIKTLISDKKRINKQTKNTSLSNDEVMPNINLEFMEDFYLKHMPEVQISCTNKSNDSTARNSNDFTKLSGKLKSDTESETTSSSVIKSKVRKTIYILSSDDDEIISKNLLENEFPSKNSNKAMKKVSPSTLSHTSCNQKSLKKGSSTILTSSDDEFKNICSSAKIFAPLESSKKSINRYPLMKVTANSTTESSTDSIKERKLSAKPKKSLTLSVNSIKPSVLAASNITSSHKNINMHVNPVIFDKDFINTPTVSISSDEERHLLDIVTNFQSAKRLSGNEISLLHSFSDEQNNEKNVSKDSLIQIKHTPEVKECLVNIIRLDDKIISSNSTITGSETLNKVNEKSNRFMLNSNDRIVLRDYIGATSNIKKNIKILPENLEKNVKITGKISQSDITTYAKQKLNEKISSDQKQLLTNQCHKRKKCYSTQESSKSLDNSKENIDKSSDVQKPSIKAALNNSQIKDQMIAESTNRIDQIEHMDQMEIRTNILQERLDNLSKTAEATVIDNEQTIKQNEQIDVDLFEDDNLIDFNASLNNECAKTKDVSSKNKSNNSVDEEDFFEADTIIYTQTQQSPKNDINKFTELLEKCAKQFSVMKSSQSTAFINSAYGKYDNFRNLFDSVLENKLKVSDNVADFNVATTNIKVEDKCIQTDLLVPIKRMAIKSVQTEGESGFLISATEEFKTQTCISASVQTEPMICLKCQVSRKTTCIISEQELSPSFDGMDFETQAVIKESNQRNKRTSKRESQLLNSGSFDNFVFDTQKVMNKQQKSQMFQPGTFDGLEFETQDAIKEHTRKTNLSKRDSQLLKSPSFDGLDFETQAAITENQKLKKCMKRNDSEILKATGDQTVTQILNDLTNAQSENILVPYILNSSKISKCKVISKNKSDNAIKPGPSKVLPRFNSAHFTVKADVEPQPGTSKSNKSNRILFSADAPDLSQAITSSHKSNKYYLKSIDPINALIDEPTPKRKKLTDSEIMHISAVLSPTYVEDNASRKRSIDESPYTKSSKNRNTDKIHELDRYVMENIGNISKQLSKSDLEGNLSMLKRSIISRNPSETEIQLKQTTQDSVMHITEPGCKKPIVIKENSERFKRIRNPSDSDDELVMKKFVKYDLSVHFDSPTEDIDKTCKETDIINMDYLNKIYDNVIDNNESTTKKIVPPKVELASTSKKTKSQEMIDQCSRLIANFTNKEKNELFKKAKLETVVDDLALEEFENSYIPIPTLYIKSQERVKFSQLPIGKNISECVFGSEDIVPPTLDASMQRKCKNINANKDLLAEFNQDTDMDLDMGMIKSKDFQTIQTLVDNHEGIDFLKEENLTLNDNAKVNILHDYAIVKDPIVDSADNQASDSDEDIIDTTPQKMPEIHSKYQPDILEIFDSPKHKSIIVYEQEDINDTIVNISNDTKYNEQDVSTILCTNSERIFKPIPTNINRRKESFSENSLFGSQTENISPIKKIMVQSKEPIKFIKKTTSTPLQPSIRKYMKKDKIIKDVAKKGKELFKFAQHAKIPSTNDSCVEMSQDIVRKRKRICITTTRVGKDQSNRIVSFINKKSNEMTFQYIFDANVTHLVVDAKTNNCLDCYTTKVLQAIAYRIWIVDFNWIAECIKEDRIVCELPYEVFDSRGNPGPRESRMLGTRPPLLAGFKIYLSTPFAQISVTDLLDIIALLGGQIALSVDEFLNKDKFIYLIIAENDQSQDIYKYQIWLEQLKVVTVELEWLTFSIGQYKHKSLRRYALCSEDIDGLGYPPNLIEHVPLSPTQSTCQESAGHNEQIE